MTPLTAIKGALLLLGGWQGLALHGQEVKPPLMTGRCQLDLPLDAGQAFDRQRFLVLKDRTYLFDQDWKAPGLRWRVTSRRTDDTPGTSLGPFRTRKKWRDGGLWMMQGQRILKWDPQPKKWVLQADPGLEFMDFEVDMTGRILLVCTADPKTRTYRALLEAVEPGERSTTVLAPYPDPGSQAWGRKISPIAAASLQAGYESTQILEFTVLFNPLARRLFLFRPLEDRIQEVQLGLPHRGYQDLVKPGTLDDLCWQILPKDASEAWLVLNQPGPEGAAGLAAIPLDLFEGLAGEARPLPGLSLPVLPDPSGRLRGLEEALAEFDKGAKGP